MGRACQVLTVDDIVEINRRMIAEFGGIFFAGDYNLANPGSLEHVLEEVQGSLFGYEPYPTLIEKAAAIGWRIIAGHVFHDGNKRTGMEACRLFLELNGHIMRIDSEVVRISLQIANGAMELGEFVQWLKQRTTPSETADSVSSTL
jgi:death-on-curing protein